MQKTMNSLRAFLGAAKQAAKDRGDIKGDADLAVRVSESLEAMGLPKVDRGAVNHWIKGRNQPSMAQFLALCSALSVTPSDALSGNVYTNGQGAEKSGALTPIEDEVISLMRQTNYRGHVEIAYFARETVFSSVWR